MTTLTKDLLLIEDALSHSLEERKIRYIFEGVSHLVAAIFIGAALDILKKSEEFKTNTTAASKYILRRPRISINGNPPFKTQIYLVNTKK